MGVYFSSLNGPVPGKSSGSRLGPSPSDDDRVVVVTRDEVREVAVGGEQVELHGQIVHGGGAALVQHAAEHGEGLRLALGVGQQVHRVDDVGRGHRRAVLERHAAAQLERPLGGVGVGRPALGQHGLDLERLGSVIARNSPTCPSMHRPPWSPTVTGLIAPVGTTMAAFSVPPGLIAPVEPPDAGAAAGAVGAAARAEDDAEEGDRHPHHGAAAEETLGGKPCPPGARRSGGFPVRCADGGCRPSLLLGETPVALDGITVGSEFW